ncbi:MAG: DUF3108 domain-containing protein [Xanthomonadales bacterium]|nr:DUF3108 domain-containing protein [Xanthomonadales bacterium]
MAAAPLLALLSLAAAEAPLPPFAGEYLLLRNGREVGEARIAYGPTADGWRIESALDAGLLGGMLSFRSREHSRLAWREGLPASERFHARREQPLRSREQEILVDPAAGTVTVRDSRRGESRHPLPGPALDPLAALLRAALAAKREERRFAYLEVNRGAPRERAGRIAGSLRLRVGERELECIRVERLSEDPDRLSASCHAPALGYAPVLIEHADDGERLELRLRALPAPAP